MLIARRCVTLVLLITLCMLPRQAADAESPAVITILHFNDVYEIEPIEAGHFGGLSRVTTVLQQLKRTHAPVLSVLAGDYLSPSAIGTAVVDGQPLGGRHHRRGHRWVHYIRTYTCGKIVILLR